MEGVGFMPTKLKRKDLDQVNDEFSDFSLSAPARKIRRLDADLWPIMEEEEPSVPPVVYDPGMIFEEKKVYGGPVIEELEAVVPVNEERAIVLFKPVDAPLFQSPSNLSLSVDPNLISGLKNDIRISSYYDNVNQSYHEAAMQNPNGCRAVVPWVPNQFSPTQTTEDSITTEETEVLDLMDADEMGEATMDIEQDDNNNSLNAHKEHINQWPQPHHHCMIPQPHQNMSTPITWFR